MKKSYKLSLVLVICCSVLLSSAAMAWANSSKHGGNQNACSGQTSTVGNCTTPFADVPGWASKAIGKMYGMGIISGFPDRKFHPNSYITRAQLATLLVKEYHLSVSQEVYTPTFADVPANSNSWAYQFIEAAAQDIPYNIINGEALFRPKDPATRQDAIVAMVKASGLSTSQTADPSVLSKFADENEIAPALVDLVAIAVQDNLVTGYQGKDGNWYLDPQGYLTRAQAACLLYNGLVITEVAPGTGVSSSVYGTVYGQ